MLLGLYAVQMPGPDPVRAEDGRLHPDGLQIEEAPEPTRLDGA